MGRRYYPCSTAGGSPTAPWRDLRYQLALAYGGELAQARLEAVGQVMIDREEH